MFLQIYHCITIVGIMFTFTMIRGTRVCKERVSTQRWSRVRVVIFQLQICSFTFSSFFLLLHVKCSVVISIYFLHTTVLLLFCFKSFSLSEPTYKRILGSAPFSCFGLFSGIITVTKLQLHIIN